MISIFIELALFSQTPDKARVNMRLLKTKSYELIEAKDIPSPFPHYAVLSHTWISPKDEVTYQDIKLRKEDIKNDIFKQKGWSKLKNYCERARKDGWEWAWMDTCCIDKTNAADTQEAINAMFRWYQNAGVCYAYLEDVDVFKLLIDADLLKDVDLLKVLKDVNLFKALKNVGLPKDVDLLKTLKAVNLLKEAIDLDEIVSSGKFTDSNSSLRTAVRPFFTNAKWFSRGWTLQELLAPHYLIFVDRAWCHMGTRESWAVEIEKASHVEARHLTDFKPTDSTKCSIAMKLSWASRRETTLPEDETYSLLGLFGISMPLIYGEGRWRAFNRLQRELIMVYNDDSIFAWKAEQSSKEHLYKERHGVIGPSDERFLIPQREEYNSGYGILARSVKQFWSSSKIEAFGYYGSSFSITNRGLEINAKHWTHKDNPFLCLVRLNCGGRPREHKGIYLSQVHNTYDRINISELCDMEKINYNDWEEENSSTPILIRANNHSDLLACSSIFALHYPEQIKIGAKYFMDFGPPNDDDTMKLLDQGSHSELVHDLRKDELVVEPNRIVFINIELQNESIKSYFDVVVNLTENSFPFVGILERWKGKWERLGDPLGQALETYNALATYFHYKVPSEPPYPMIAEEETGNNRVVRIHLLPKPLQGRSFNLPSERAELVTLREYVLKITIEQNDHHDEDPSERHAKKRSKIS